jgi:phosphoglycerol transferase MdoB-like AlkP superfamily enzyme
MIRSHKKDSALRFFGAMAIAVFLLAASVFMTFLHHSGAGNPALLETAQQEAALQAKMSVAQSMQSHAVQKHDAAAALEKNTQQLRVQTEAAIASA